MFKSEILESSVLQKLKQRFKHNLDWWLDIVSTEYNYHLRHRAINQQLNLLRKVPKILFIEGANICNASQINE